MGFEKTVLKEGNGAFPTPGKNVTVHCTGYGKNGDLSVPFWSTKDPGQNPFTFTIGKKEVIKGWDEGVLIMKLGEIARIHCSPGIKSSFSSFNFIVIIIIITLKTMPMVSRDSQPGNNLTTFFFVIIIIIIIRGIMPNSELIFEIEVLKV